MHVVKVKRAELLDVVKKNREEHRKLFEEAQVGFRARVIERLDKMLSDARAGVRYDLMVSLAPPIDQTKDYDRIIKALEMSVDEEIELDEREFAQYVMDDWQWKQNVLATNSAYTVSR